MTSAKITNRGYSGSVTVPEKDRRWVKYQYGKKWLVTKTGGFGKVSSFDTEEEAEKFRKEKEENKN